jgi:hypothetical protein
MAKWCDGGENYVLDVCFKKATSPPTNIYLGIYTNSSEPAEDADLTDITEPSGFGYARIAIACGGDWTLSNNELTAVQKTFTASGGAWGNCYGYFLCTVASGTAGVLLGVEQFSDGPYNVQNGGSIKVTAKLTAS